MKIKMLLIALLFLVLARPVSASWSYQSIYQYYQSLYRLKLVTPITNNLNTNNNNFTNVNWTDQVNAYRTQFGLSSISEDSHSCDFAQKRSADIVTDFSHSGFNLNNILTYYPTYRYAIENIAYGQQDNTIIQAWINSPSHAENMRSNVTYLCTRKTISNGRNYYVMEGYRPQ